MPETATRRNWTRVAFGDVVRLSKERSRDPDAEGFARYVGLEHLEPGDLKIRSWGDVADGTTFTSVFRPGQVLFGKRRAYQRKLAVAEFSGVCSGDIYVFEPANDHLMPELLPFVCQTDAFFEHAIGTSAGSLSPRTNWKSLATYEFALPPLDEQRRMAHVLVRAATVLEALHELETNFFQLLHRFIIDSFDALSSVYKSVPLGSFGEATMGRQKSPKYTRGIAPRPYLRVANIGWMTLNLEEIEQMDFSPTELERYRLLPGDILLTEGDLISQFNVGRPAIFDGEVADCCFQNTLIRFRPHQDIPPLFMLLLLEGARLSLVFAEAAKTTTVTHLGLGRFREITLPLPPSNTRRVLAERLSLFLRARDLLAGRRRESSELLKRLSAEVFV